MPRAPRIEYEGALYHVMCRDDRREAISRGDQDREMFFKTLGESCEVVSVPTLSCTAMC